MRHEISKDHNVGSNRINRIYFILTMTKYIYFNMDIVGYLIFINLLVNHIKIILLKIDSLHKFSL